jgi:hypothetical protein
MSRSCAQWRGDIGAYLVGGLDGCARDRLTRHLAACADCRADCDELVPVRDWLALLAATGGLEPDPAEQPGRPLHDAPGEGPLPLSLLAARPDALVPRPCRRSGTQLPAQPGDELRAIRPRTRRWRPAAGAALAAAAAAVAVLVSSGAPARTFRAADSVTGVSAQAQLHDTPTGTQIDLTATGLPGDERCILAAVTRGGTDIAGSWDATYDGSAQMTGTTAFPANRLTALRIEADTGVVLLTIRV